MNAELAEVVRQRLAAGFASNMPKMRKKADLPRKICAACGRPFTWRKKWAKDWDQVKTCSDRCKDDGRKRKQLVTT